MVKKKPKENRNGFANYGIRMSKNMKAQIDYLAEKGNRPFSAEVRLAIENHISRSIPGRIANADKQG